MILATDHSGIVYSLSPPFMAIRSLNSTHPAGRVKSTTFHLWFPWLHQPSEQVGEIGVSLHIHEENDVFGLLHLVCKEQSCAVNLT